MIQLFLLEFNTIPDNLQNWNLETIDGLIKLRDTESENLDFKEKPSDLSKHISALANTTGGFLILGIAPVKDSINKTISCYKKIGFKTGKEDEIGLEISNSCFCISPTPAYKIKHICDDSVFYSVIKIRNEISKKPFFIKDRAQCFVRIDNSSRPATRSTIMNLFGASIEYHKNIQNLQSACILLKESLSWTINYLSRISVNDSTRPAPVDLIIFRSSVLSAMEFVTENDLLGHRSKTTIHQGVTTIIDTIEQLNAQIRIYNTSENLKVKEDVKSITLCENRVLSQDIEETPKLLDKVISKTSEFLSKTK